MTPEQKKKATTELVAQVMRIQKTYAHEQVGAKNDRRNEIKKAINSEIRQALRFSATPPQQRQENQTQQPRWTLKRLVAWINNQFNLRCCREQYVKLSKN